VIPRAAVVVAGLAALALAFPGAGPLGVALVLVGLAALAVALVRPWSEAPALVIAAAVAAWLLGDGSAGVLRCAGLAAALCAVHFSAALAAVVPPRAALDRRLLLPWALRWVATSAVGIVLVLATAALPRTPAPAATALAAVVVLAGITVAGWRLAQRPRDDREA
jgi:hypothetical protein